MNDNLEQIESIESAFVSFGQRWLIRLIDGFVLFIMYAFFIIMTLTFEGQAILFISLMYAFGLLYIIGLKSTKYGTLGNLMTGTKVIDLDGNRPSLFKSSLRIGGLLFFPTMLILDLLLISKSRQNQTFSDRLSETLVVKKSFKGVNRIKKKPVIEFIYGYCFCFIDAELK